MILTKKNLAVAALLAVTAFAAAAQSASPAGLWRTIDDSTKKESDVTLNGLAVMHAYFRIFSGRPGTW